MTPFDAVLTRIYDRQGIDTLPGHLEETYGIGIEKVAKMDVGVFRVDRHDGGEPLVARLLPAARPHEAAEADLAVLRYLEEIDFPAERPFGQPALFRHEGQSVLLTGFVRPAPKAKRPAYPIVKLGALIGKLHGLPVPAGADRRAGGLHHFVEGTMTDELGAVSGWLKAIDTHVPEDAVEGLDELRTAVNNADGGDGLPEAFVHPDPVPKNAIFTASGPVLIDWTSAGRGPRLASISRLLRSGWAAVPFMKGYNRLVALTQEERERLPGLIYGRGLIDLAFRFCRDPTPVSTGKLTALRRDSLAKARAVLEA